MLIINQQQLEKAISPAEMLAAIEHAYLIQDHIKFIFIITW